MAASYSLTADQLRSLLHYDRDTGVFTWRVTRGGMRAGAVAGKAHNRGYVTVSIFKHGYLAHRLAWFYERGEWPTEIDHINRVKNDNRICNLRLATRQQNLQNSGMPRNNTSGHLGVAWRASKQRWRAFIGVNNRHVHLGNFLTMEEAIAARLAAEERYFGQFQPEHSQSQTQLQRDRS